MIGVELNDKLVRLVGRAVKPVISLPSIHNSTKLLNVLRLPKLP